MKTTNWKYIAELIGIAAIVASLVFVGLQMQQTREIALSESHLIRAGSNAEIGMFRAQNADVWLRGNAGDKLTSLESVIYAELLRSYWHSAYWTTLSERELGFGSDVSLHIFAAFLFRNPGARKYWEDWQRQDRIDLNLLIEDRSSAPNSPEIVRQSLLKLDQATAQ